MSVSEHFEIDELAFPETSESNFGLFTFAYLEFVVLANIEIERQGLTSAGPVVQGIAEDF